MQKQPARSLFWLGLACALGGLALVAQVWKGMTLDPVGQSAQLVPGGLGLLLPHRRRRASANATRSR